MNLFLFCEPLRGQRWVTVTERRTKADWAHQIKELVEVRYPDAERIRLVLDNLNPLRRPRCMRFFRAPKRSAWPTSWRSITPPNMAVG